jgi:hypothetical protein
MKEGATRRDTESLDEGGIITCRFGIETEHVFSN